MADDRPPAPQALPVIPPTSPAQLVIPSTQPGQEQPLNWPYFKPGFAGKPAEDAEAHLCRTNDWMDTHASQ